MDSSLAEVLPNYLVQVPPEQMRSKTEKIGIVGLGYVGLPISVALSDFYDTVIGYDINPARIEALKNADDQTLEIDRETLLNTNLTLTSSPDDLANCTIYIVAVPTPVNDAQKPDFQPLRQTCQTLAPFLSKGDVVIFESTVYPGATEEICGPELELYSGYQAGVDFNLAYSPERITPGDKAHGLEEVTKIVSADNRTTLERIVKIYERIVPAGVHRAPSIRVAEAAKVFENTQRDVNIALMNEFASICDKIGIQTRDVIHATGTKWNALPFTPGLVGGHCIGVDPFYLTSKAEELGEYPEIMLASRRRNEAMAANIATKAIKFLAQDKIDASRARVGVFGTTFKEDVPDMRNSKVVDIIAELRSYGIDPLVHDPWADSDASVALGVPSQPIDELDQLDILILAVPHSKFVTNDGRPLQNKLRRGGVMMDIKSALEPSFMRSDISYWSL